MATNEPPSILLESEANAGVRVVGPSPGVKRRSLRNRRSEAMQDLPPSMRVRFILGEDADKPGQNEPRPVFSEMEEFKSEDGTGGEWKEVARWIKFEEDVEDGGNRWTKPFVGTLSLHALFELRSALLNGTLLLDAEATTVDEVINVIVDKVCSTHQLTAEQKNQMTEVMCCPHRHLYEVVKSAPLLMSEKSRNSSAKNLTESRSKMGLALPSVPSMAAVTGAKGNSPFMKKIPPGAEVNNVLVGEVDFLDKPVSAFVRLSKATILGDFAEVRLPSRFVFLLLGPKGQLEDYREVGRVVATLMSDEVFNAVAYRAKNRDHLLAGIDEFMDAVTILPPGEWDPSIRIEPPTKVPSQEPRKNPDKPPEEKEDPALEELKVLESQGLVRTGRFFGGLIDDVKRKLPFYKSDFTDAFAVQSIASITFLYFASLSPIITFGGLLGDATENRLAALESLCAGCICGIIYSLFAGQPLALLNATGPVLVFEGILYNFCSKNGYDYLSLRLWVGVWMGVFMITLCAFEISAWVAFITRFTEENFALLIATIYVYKAVEKIIYIGLDNPLNPPEPKLNATDCYCFPHNDTIDSLMGSVQGGSGPFNWTGLATNSCAEMWNGTLKGEDCFPKEWYPNVFLMSVLLSVFTYSVCVTLKGLKHTLYFPYKVRSTISDFAVFIAICSMTGLDYYAGVHTPKLHVPSDFKPTWSGRGWTVNPIHPDNPWWIIPGAMLPAALATILLFLDQQITAVIVNRKENKLKKGCGYHLDLFVLAILTALMGILGLPWHVAGTVICINHVNSLKQESETAAPGEKPVFLGVREQRVTHLIIFLLVGLSVFMTPILKFIPMPVLYGVFLYMGTAPLAEMHFFDRLRIVFMPAKYQPDFNYLRKVPLKRVHMYTAIQLVCFAILWVVKTNETISISFPLMLVIMIFIRKSLDYVFTREELHVLDSVIPPFRRKKQEPLVESGSKSHINGKGQSYSAIPKNSSKVNISDEVARSGAWLHVNQSKASFQDCSGTEMTSYRRKDYGGEKVSDDESEPLTFLSGTKRIQIQPGSKNNQ
ncbi:sodium bicarbonate cotransporter 3-like isoform X1 [Daphnia pulex]|uniref:sodium bicarbonate cotransporter 3-like isoform X1 n=1 Tax=Daphnia pulex TaxID=6669 RepID=UPI001EDCFB1D|nr:sodium bicarbonate cotransporter 3-like isoform X1 [Daphnia pulex]